MKLLQKIASDPRHFQIAALSILLGLQSFWSDFEPSLPVMIITLTSITGFQLALSRKQKFYDLRSPLITGLSLCLLLRAAEWWFFPLAALLAIGAKFLIRYENKHVFNPSNIAIVALLLVAPHSVWISPGQWGSEVWLVFLLAMLSFFVLYRIPKADIVLFFFGSYITLLFIRCFWLGDPMSIPLHQIQSGALLIFGFFMISDPKPTPDHRLGRLVFALAVAAIGFTLQFGFQIREGLFYALALVSLATPLLDKYFLAPRYEWRTT